MTVQQQQQQQLNDLPQSPTDSAGSGQQTQQQQQHHNAQRYQHHNHHHHHHHQSAPDAAYNITTAEADLDYNDSDNSLAAVLQHHHHPAVGAHHHHRYMPSSASSCDNTKQPPSTGNRGLGCSASSAGGSCDENTTPSVLDVNLDSKKVPLVNSHCNSSSRLSTPVRFGSADERKYTNNHQHHHHHHHQQHQQQHQQQPPHHHHHHHHHIEVYSDGASGLLDSSNKLEEENHHEISEDDRGPPLPPRPAPRTRTLQRMDPAPIASGVRKYVIWCLICGGISSLLGVLFLGIYFLLRSYTSTVGYFETVPTFVPATLLMLTGICIMSLARRRNRYSYLIKLSGACGLASALTCALVTVTTTVLHMSRLQVLRECEYTQKTRTCTCYSVTADKQPSDGVDDSVRFVFDSTSDCGVVHGALYSCLRAVFGLSVAGVLVAVFSCMLVYQLLSHERKKMYWEQLELRCRSLYSGQGPPGGPTAVLPPGAGGGGLLGPSGGLTGPGPGGMPGAPGMRAGNCRCCEQCHAHRNVLPAAYPWEGDGRFWTPGQAGNFYSPNPGGDETLGGAAGGGGGGGGIVGTGSGGRLNASGRRMPGWSWPRMPWQRNETAPQRMSPHSPDSQYGFASANRTSGGQPPPGGPAVGVVGALLGDPGQPRYNVIEQQYGIWGPPPPYSDPNSPARRGGRYQYIHPAQCGPPTMMEPGLSMVGAPGAHLMGPGSVGMAPPPNASSSIAILECHQHAVMGVDVHGIPQQYVTGQQSGVGGGLATSGPGHPGGNTSGTNHHYSRGTVDSTPATGGASKRQHQPSGGGGGGGYSKGQSKESYENTPSDSDGPGRDRFSATLPLRKAKKRVEAGAKSIGPNQPASRVNVQNVFQCNAGGQHQQQPPTSLDTSENEYNEPTTLPGSHGGGSSSHAAGTGLANDCRSGPGSPSVVSHRLLPAGSGGQVQPPKTRRLKPAPSSSGGGGGGGGVENSGFQTVEALEAEAAAAAAAAAGTGGKLLEPTESEVYFADVSSCCNMSVKNDNYYEDAGQRRKTKDKQQHPPPDQVADEYIAQRFGKREPSVRSRMPFPQTAALTGSGEKPPVMPRSSLLLPKDHSRQSMCSVDSGERTDYTDLSPGTPSTNFPSIASSQQQQQQQQHHYHHLREHAQLAGHHVACEEPPKETIVSTAASSGCSFIASYPYSSNEQSQEAHRRSTKNLHDLFLAPDSQYEDMPVQFPSAAQHSAGAATTGGGGGSGSGSGSGGAAGNSTSSTASPSSAAVAGHHHHHHHQSVKPKSPKNLNITPIKRQSLGTNISSIIQNLSGHDVGLLYPEPGGGPMGRASSRSNSSSYNQSSDRESITGSSSALGGSGRGRVPGDIKDISVSSNEDNEDTSNDERCGGTGGTGGGGGVGDRRL
ncbi:uncharacterized protein LOC126574749 isoform X2 [Anopheles aquasalis]|uniref:uncharacterized protein LOC126574749 isoform X2 n=1 Tax=Anopheles aquasalis TaxID=42839 RepID=UPI00215ACDEA|nr:uncharacterized protein LOC126574749 isoform X2 [Anopheles aquasalis]